MALWSIPAMAALRWGYAIAEKKKWLPKGAYHRQSLTFLKRGDIAGAERCNRIALQKAEDYEAALIVKDVIAMHRDARLQRFQEQKNQQVAHIVALNSRIATLKRQHQGLQKRLQRYRYCKAGIVFLLLLMPAVVIAGLGLYQRPAALLAYLFLLLLIYLYSRSGFLDKKKVQSELDLQSNCNSIQILERKIALHLTHIEKIDQHVRDQIHTFN